MALSPHLILPHLNSSSFLNLPHDILDSKTKTSLPKKQNAYQVYVSEVMKGGMKMGEAAAAWRSMGVEEQQKYRDAAAASSPSTSSSSSSSTSSSTSSSSSIGGTLQHGRV